MAEQSGISWTDATFNPWIGCTKVSNDAQVGACVNCYAERDNKLRKWVPGWGPGEPRKRTSLTTWNQPHVWNRQHPAFYAQHGRRRRVFSASLADIFDNEVSEEWRSDFWKIVQNTPNLWWLILSKRIGNAKHMQPKEGLPANVVLMATIVTQEEWDRDIEKLMSINAALHGVSDEPTLAPINMGDVKIDWMITGGESGPGHRALNFDNVRTIRDQCARHDIAFHHKQNGGFRGKDGGCLLDGVEHKAFPAGMVD